ncbi:MAG: penicillin acylase family protein, partial [Pseudomonadales bacterium]
MKNTLIVVLTLILASCSQEDPAPGSPETTTEGTGNGYETTIRWTSYGIPHIKADDWGSLGFGAGYSLARDAICVLAEEVVTVNGDRARYFGPGEDRKNLNRDVFHRALLSEAAIERFENNMNSDMQAMTDGYIAGYNRYLQDHRGELPTACKGKDWVRPINRDDVAKITVGVGIRYGWGRIVDEIANATPPDDHKDGNATTAALEPLPQLTPDTGKTGSNAYAIGKSLTRNGKGLLLGNPHYPWKGPSRFHMAHFTLPGELDIMGVGLYTTGTFVAIGFNRHVAWSHTVSTALRFTLFELSLVDGNPLAYHFDDEQRELEQRTVTVEVMGADDKIETLEKTVYMSDFGPVFESEDTPWTRDKAYVMRDINFENNRGAPQYFHLGQATSVTDIEESLARHQGVSFVNTVAADRHGNAFYGDMSAIPYVDQELLERCKTGPEQVRGRRVIVLDGSRQDCQWKSDDSAAAPGVLPPEELPRLTTDSYVTNSNDSYWLSNPDQPLEGYAPIIGDEGTARSLRTRAGINFIQEIIDAGKKFDRQTVQDIMYNHRH